MNRKLTLILTLLILAVISVSIVTAVNNTHDSVATDNSKDSVSQDEAVDDSSDDKIAVADDDDVQTSQDTDKLSAEGLTVKKVWDDNNNEAGKRPSSINFKVIEDGKDVETSEINENMNWQVTLDMRISQDSTYEVAEVDVPDGYEANVTGSVENGFVITNTLKDVPKNDTDKNTTPTNKDPENKKPTNDEPKKSEPKKVTKVTTKTTTKEVPAKKQAKKQANETKDDKKKHDTGNPVLLGVLAVSLAGLAYALRRRE